MRFALLALPLFLLAACGGDKPQPQPVIVNTPAAAQPPNVVVVPVPPTK